MNFFDFMRLQGVKPDKWFILASELLMNQLNYLPEIFIRMLLDWD